MRPLQSASIVNKKDHSHVSRSFGRVWRRAYGLPYAEASRQSRPAVAFPACVSTCAPQHWRPGHCPPFHAPIHPRHWPIIQQHPTGVCGDSPARRLGADRPLRSPLQHPGRFVTFRARRRLLCRSIDGVATSAGNSIGDWPEIAPRPSRPTGNPTPITPVKGGY